jgi:hypothetical protein
MKRKVVAFLMGTLATVAVSQEASASGPSPDRRDERFVYAVHAICGFGFTSINVLNPNEQSVKLTKSGIALQFGQAPTPPKDPQQEILGPHWAFLMNCEDIATLSGISPAGAANVVIDSDRELDVWAVYTVLVAGGGVGDTRIVRIKASKNRK